MKIQYNSEGKFDIEDMPVEVLTFILKRIHDWADANNLMVQIGGMSWQDAKILSDWISKSFYDDALNCLIINDDDIKDREDKGECKCAYCSLGEIFKDVSPEDIIGK
jgi:hypothetical protein